MGQKILKEKVHINAATLVGLRMNFSKRYPRCFFSSVYEDKRRRYGEPARNRHALLLPITRAYWMVFLIVSFLKRKFMKKTYMYAKEQHFKNPVMRF